jgi:transposase
MRLMYSGRDFAWLYERQDQVSFLDGHVRALAHFGAVPQRIAYDYVPRHIIEELEKAGVMEDRLVPVASLLVDLGAP